MSLMTRLFGHYQDERKGAVHRAHMVSFAVLYLSLWTSLVGMLLDYCFWMLTPDWLIVWAMEPIFKGLI